MGPGRRPAGRRRAGMGPRAGHQLHHVGRPMATGRRAGDRGHRPTDRGQLGDVGGPWPPGGGPRRAIAAGQLGPRPADLVPGAARSGAPGAARVPSLAGGHGGRITLKKVTNRRAAVIPDEKKPATRAGGQAGGRLMRACLQRRPSRPASAQPCPRRRPGRR